MEERLIAYLFKLDKKTSVWHSYNVETQNT